MLCNLCHVVSCLCWGWGALWTPRTVASGDDAGEATLPIATDASTYRGSVSFIPVPETRYYVTFSVVNGAGLTTAVFSDVGLLFTETAPAVREERFGRGEYVGLHKAAHNNTRAVNYTVDNVFYNVLARQVHGTVELVACPAASESSNSTSNCTVADVQAFSGRFRTTESIEESVLVCDPCHSLTDALVLGADASAGLLLLRRVAVRSQPPYSQCPTDSRDPSTVHFDVCILSRAACLGCF